MRRRHYKNNKARGRGENITTAAGLTAAPLNRGGALMKTADYQGRGPVLLCSYTGRPVLWSMTGRYEPQELVGAVL